MSNYLKSELYRILHCKFTYVFIAISSVLLLSSSVLLAIVKHVDDSFPYAITDFAFGIVNSNLLIVYLLCIIVSNMIFGNEHYNHTFKNTVSYGIPRGKIYIGKFLIESIYALVALMIILGIHILGAFLLLENTGTESLRILLRSYFACIPFFLSALALTHCFGFIMESVGNAIATAVGIMIALPMVCNILAMKFELFRKIAGVLPWNLMGGGSYDEVNQVMRFYWSTGEGFRNCWIYGILQMLLYLIIGYIAFRKKEIK